MVTLLLHGANFLVDDKIVFSTCSEMHEWIEISFSSHLVVWLFIGGIFFIG